MVKLVVVGPPDFSIYPSTTQGQILVGNSGSFTVNTGATVAFNSAITFSASGQASGVSFSFSPPSIPAPGGGSTTATIVVATNTIPGVYPITITGTGGGVTHTFTYTLTVLAPDFQLVLQLVPNTVYWGGQEEISVQCIDSNGFNTTVSLSLSGLPSGVTVSSFPTSTFSYSPGTEGWIYLSVNSTTEPGTYPITVTGSGGGVTHSYTVNVTVLPVPTLAFSASPTSLTVIQGSSSTATITATVSGGFNSQVTFSGYSPFPGLSASVNPSSAPAPGNGSSTLTVNADSTAGPGFYWISTGASGGGLSQSIRIPVTVIPPPAFNSVNVGTTSASVPFAFTFTSAVTLGSTSVLTGGTAGLDFADSGTGTCAVNTAYAIGQTCTVNVTFTPKGAGTRNGAIVLRDSGGNVFATADIEGTGLGPQVSFLPGAQSLISIGGLSHPTGIAVDERGDVFISDTNNNRVLKETLSAGGYIENVVTSDVQSPASIALDGVGNIFVADTLNGRVLKETPTATGYSESVLLSAFGTPLAVAVDSSGNLYSATSTTIYEFYPPIGSEGYSNPGFGFNNPSSLVVDDTGNIFVADTGNNAVKEILAPTQYLGARSTVTLLSGLASPTGLTLDGQGNLYISDTGNNRVLEILKAGGYTTVQTLPGNYSGPNGVAVSGSGNLYVANSGTNLVTMEDFADPPSLAFASTPLGTTSADSPHLVTLKNIGNADLNFAIPATGNNPSIATNFTLASSAPNGCPVVNSGASAPGTLAAGASCALSISFTPTAAGSLSGSLALTDNNLNATAPAYASQSISLAGTGTHATPVITWPTPMPIAYGAALSATQLDATASVPGTFSYSPVAGTVLSAGIQILAATFTPTDTTDYTTANTTVQLTVNKATPVISWPTPAPITCRTALSSTQLGATANVPGTFAYSPAAGTVLSVGTQVLTVTFTPTDIANYTTATTTVQLTVNKATPAISWSTPAPITYGTTLSSSQLNATANVPGTFVYSPAAGTILPVGNNTLSAVLTPSDAVDYTTASASVTLVVNPVPGFTLTASPSSVSIKQGSKGSSTVSVNATGGFSGNVSLAISGLPKGVTAAFSQNPVTKTSMLTFTVSNSATTGTSSVTITGTSGSLVQTTAIALTVVHK